MGAKLSSFLLKNNPWTRSSDGARSDVQILCNLAGTILADIKETELGKEPHMYNVEMLLNCYVRTYFFPGREFSLDAFVPIGNFTILQPDGLSKLLTDFTMPQVQEAVLKDPSRSIKGLDDIKDGHSLEDFYFVHITRLQKTTLQNRRTVQTENQLQPTQSGKAYVMVRRGLSGEYDCALMLKGSFLQIQMDGDLNDFHCLPFTSASTTTLSMVNLLL